MTRKSISPETVLGLVETLYDAVLHPESLNDFCARLKDVTSCHIGAIFLQDYLRPGGTYLASDGFDRALTERYDRDFASKNILMERAMRDMRPGLVCVSEQHVSTSEWEMSDYYNGFVKPHDAFYVAGGCIAYDRGVSAMVTLGRRRGGGSFETSQRALIGSVLPHLRNVLEIQRRLGFLELRSELGWQVVDRLQFAVLCLSETMTICFANQRARQLLAVRDGISERAGRLMITDRRDRERLQLLCMQCAQRESPQGGPVRVRRNHCHPSLTGYVCPIDASRTPSGLFDRPTAIVLLADPLDETNSVEETLRVYFGITPAESRVALRLVRGNSLMEIANELRVSINTVKTQLKQLMHRTGTSRQSELVACLLRRIIHLSPENENSDASCMNG